jgi:RING finger/CHY zinc finger protein 1
LNRFEVREMRCTGCLAVQPAAAECRSCRSSVASYFCSKCHLWSDKQAFHCDGCGICYKEEDRTHCDGCGLCFPATGEHACPKKKIDTADECTVCLEPLYLGVVPPSFLLCGHAVHSPCLKGLAANGRASCPLCHKMFVDADWSVLDDLVAEFPVPDDHRRAVRVRCYECSEASETLDHPVGRKCGSCGGYNTYLV